MIVTSNSTETDFYVIGGDVYIKPDLTQMIRDKKIKGILET